MSSCSAVETPPMSHRSQVANSGSSPIDACSAACAAPGTSRGVDAAGLELLGRQRPPDRLGLQMARRQVERLLAEHLTGRRSLLEVGHDLRRHLDRAERQPSRRPTAAVTCVPRIVMSVRSRALVE